MIATTETSEEKIKLNHLVCSFHRDKEVNCIVDSLKNTALDLMTDTLREPVGVILNDFSGRVVDVHCDFINVSHDKMVFNREQSLVSIITIFFRDEEQDLNLIVKPVHVIRQLVANAN